MTPAQSPAPPPQQTSKRAPDLRRDVRSGGKDTAIEDYLKAVYLHTEWQASPITPSGLALRLGVAPSSVTEMVKKLAATGLVTHVPYGAITLTDEGRLRALSVIRRHRLVETWLVEEMGYSWDEVHDEAEVLEHSISDRLLEAIADRLGNPAQDPHGDPIPTADGTVASYRAVPLHGVEVGGEARILRISDSDPSVLRTFADAGIGPGATLRVLAVTDRGVRFEADTPDGPRELGLRDGSGVWMRTRSS